MELEKRWDKLIHDQVNVHVIVPGTEEEVVQMKAELGLHFDIKAVSDLGIHQIFNLTEEQSDKTLLPLRGFGLVKDGKIIDSREDDYVGISAVSIVNNLVD